MKKIKGLDRKEFMSMIGKSNSKENKWIIKGSVTVGITFKGEEFLIDLEDLNRVQKYCWRKNVCGYIVANSKDLTNSTVWIHRVIMNPSEFEIVDHRDWNKSDNRKDNLRLCTKSQNNINIKRKRNNTSGYTGVKKARNGKWKSQISYNNKRIHLGTFETIEAAIRVRNKAEILLHKDFSGELNRNDFLEFIKEEMHYE